MSEWATLRNNMLHLLSCLFLLSHLFIIWTTERDNWSEVIGSLIAYQLLIKISENLKVTEILISLSFIDILTIIFWEKNSPFLIPQQWCVSYNLPLTHGAFINIQALLVAFEPHTERPFSSLFLYHKHSSLCPPLPSFTDLLTIPQGQLSPQVRFYTHDISLSLVISSSAWLLFLLSILL